MRIRILIILIGMSLNSVAQEQMLFDDLWILEDLVIDNNSYLPPNNEEITYVTLDFDSYVHESIQYINLFGSTCETIGGLIEFNNSSSNFSFTDGPYETLGGGCMQSQNAIYEGLYFGFFYDNYNNGNIFNYSIVINTDNSKTLTVTSFNGDQAIYGSQTLSINENEGVEISLFYNAKNKSIEIASENQLDRVSIRIFNTLGKQVFHLNKNNKEKVIINLQEFADGIYFVTLQNEINQVIRKRIIKY
ncbi:T9SS type A sorting domain-containing protein [Winogradskyella eximia]|jgi:Secretion system C-terminal sorting domain|nr:T9SS type A sorting domain-containing protein [Winogradskyella eximia]